MHVKFRVSFSVYLVCCILHYNVASLMHYSWFVVSCGVLMIRESVKQREYLPRTEPDVTSQITRRRGSVAVISNLMSLFTLHLVPICHGKS